MAKVPVGQFVHAVPAANPVEAAPGVEIEADDHGVVDRCDLHIIASQHVEIVFSVVEYLRDRIRRQEWPQGGKRVFQRNLVRLFGEHIGPAVCERDIARIVRSQGKADADEVGRHAVEGAGFGVHGDQHRCFGARYPFLQPVDRLDAFIGRTVDSRHFGQGLAASLRACLCACVFRLGGIEVIGPVRTARPCIKPAEQTSEPMLFEEFRKRPGGHAVEFHVVYVDRQPAIFLEGDQDAAEFCIGTVFDQTFFQLGLLHVLCRIECGRKIAMFCDQLASGLGPDAEDAWNVID